MTLLSIVGALLVLTVLVFVHELGHFYAGKKLGFRIDEFAIGMGPVVCSKEKNGIVPIMGRVTINGSVAQFSCKLDVEEKSWNVELGRVSGRSIAAQEANRMLDKIRVGINQAYQKIADRDNYVTAEKVRNAYLGLGMNHETLLAVFRQHNEDYGKQVGKLKSPRSYWKYCTVYKHLGLELCLFRLAAKKFKLR